MSNVYQYRKSFLSRSFRVRPLFFARPPGWALHSFFLRSKGHFKILSLYSLFCFPDYLLQEYGSSMLGRIRRRKKNDRNEVHFALCIWIEITKLIFYLQNHCLWSKISKKIYSQLLMHALLPCEGLIESNCILIQNPLSILWTKIDFLMIEWMNDFVLNSF